MVTEFKEGDDVECKAGRGTVTYCEDGFMEVRLLDRTERTFFAPFQGKVWQYVKLIPVEELPVWSEIVKHPDVSPHLGRVAQFQAVLTALASRTGGQAESWKNLADFHKCNFLAAMTGCPVAIWREAAEKGKLSTLAARWLQAAYN